MPFSSLHYTWPTVFINNDTYFSEKSKQTKCCLDHTISQEILGIGLLMHRYIQQCASRWVFLLFECYGCKKVIPFFYFIHMHILCKNKTKWSTNTSATKIFSRDTNLLPKKDQILNILDTLSPNHEGALCVAKLSIH